MSPDDKVKYQEADPRRAEQVGEGIIISSDTRRAERVPPGQARTRKWPVLQYGEIPRISREEWKLEITGLVDRPYSLTWEQLAALPQVKVFSDFHCVTRWSRLDNIWEGVSTRQLLEAAGVQPSAAYVLLHGYDSGWTTNLPLADFLSEDALVAHSHDGLPLSAEHGGPARAIVPLLYAWKSAKWLRAIELVAKDHPGYWEQGGYHLRGDPWHEERFRDDPEWTSRRRW